MSNVLEEFVSYDWNIQSIENIHRNQNIDKIKIEQTLNKIHIKVAHLFGAYCEPDFIGHHTPYLIEENIFNKNKRTKYG